MTSEHAPGVRTAAATGAPTAPGPRGQRLSSGPLRLRALLTLLREGVGEVGPWPADSDLELVCGAVLVQNTSWTNVERSLAALREETAFEVGRLLALGEETLAEVIRPSGFMTAKARSLRGYAAWVRDGGPQRAAALDDEALRAELLSLRGFGPETADVVALMVFDRPRFIFDAYGRRMLTQAGYTVGPTYEKARTALEPEVLASGLSTADLVEMHALVLEAGKRARQAGGWELYGPTIGITPSASA